MPRAGVGRNALKAVGQGALGSALGSNETMHPNLGLHGAAASGNIGLIKFALENGQPANSNLNGILPLHAACSGGNEQAVRMLLLYGAEVNAPRLKSKTSTGGAGVEGSTPLHFAAANGHLEIVRLLLEAGARPAAADKDGVQAEALAAGNGHTECVKLLRSWIAAYGTNGLAGLVSARDTVRRDMAVAPTAYSRFPGAQQGATTISGASAAGIADELAGMRSSSRSGDEGALKGQRSFDQLTWTTSAGRSSAAGTRTGSGLLKTSSNPNLKGGPSQQGQPTIFPNGQPPSASPASIHRRLADRSPSPLDPAEESEIAFSSAVTPAGPSSGSSSAGGFGTGREGKRRPSLPSILEKAAHPAASLRAALGTGQNASSGGESEQQPPPHSPNRKFGKLASKRSLSNMLRKATGTEKPSVSGSSSASSLAAGAPHEVGTMSTLTPQRPARSEQRSFDAASPHTDGSFRVDRRNPSTDTSTTRIDEESEASLARSNAAPQLRTMFSDNSVRTEAPVMSGATRQPHRLRGSASSSALSASAAARNASRARSSSNEQITLVGRPVYARMPGAGKASLDISRAQQAQAVSTQNAAEGSDFSDSSAGGQSKALSSAGLVGASRRRRPEEASSQSQDHDNSSDFTPSESSLLDGARKRAESQSSQPSLRGEGSVESRAPKPPYEGLDSGEGDDAQEFLGDTIPMSPEEAAGEHHDVHHLPASLRTLSAMRGGPRMDVNNCRLAGLVATPSNPSSPSAVPVYRGRNRSTSSLSAVSACSQPGGANTSASALETGHLRDSPGLFVASQALSIADEVGLPQTMNRSNRSGSHAESVSSRPSTSSLRSNYLSAAEQAQAILNQDPSFGDGPDGAPLSLAAQLAAYGEALAQERKRAGDVRSGPSPSLSGRASNAALKTALPSVSEDQSPTTTSPISGRRNLGAPPAAAFTGHSYPRRLSRRPHSSEGESQSAGKRSGFHTDVLRSRTVNEPAGQHAGLRSLFLAPTTPNPDVDHGARNKALGSPLSPQPPSAGAVSESGSKGRATGASRQHASSSGGQTGRPVVGAQSRASEDLLRQQRPTILTWNSDATLAGRTDLPETPVMHNGAFADGTGSSPRGTHRHSPSAPSQLASYAASRTDRAASGLPSPHPRSASATASPSVALGDHGDTPPVPPRKDSHLSSNASASSSSLLTPDAASHRSSATSSPHPPVSARKDSFGGVVGLGFEGSPLHQQQQQQQRRPSRDVPRRPSVNMMRTGTSSSVASQSTATGYDDGGGSSNGGNGSFYDDMTSSGVKLSTGGSGGGSSGGGSNSLTGKRRLVRNFLTGIKNSATGSGATGGAQ